MSKALVSIEEAEAHLRVSDDSSLSLYIEAASEAILNYLGARASDYLDTGGDVIADSAGPVGVPFVVKAATLIMLATLYDSRDAASNQDWQPGYAIRFQPGHLPGAVTALLYPLRDPTIA